MEQFLESLALLGRASGAIEKSQANTLGAHHSVIISEQEVKTGTIILRDMTTARQKTILPAELQGALR